MEYKTDMKTFLENLKKKSICDSKKEISGELYVGDKSKLVKALPYIGILMLASGITVAAFNITNKHSKLESINQSINMELNDENAFVLDQMKLEDKISSFDSKYLYSEYEKILAVVPDNESNVVEYDGKTYEVDMDHVNVIVGQAKDNWFYSNKKQAIAMNVEAQMIVNQVEHELKVEKNNAVR